MTTDPVYETIGDDVKTEGLHDVPYFRRYGATLCCQHYIQPVMFLLMQYHR